MTSLKINSTEPTLTPQEFQAAILKFYSERGRKHLPWQQDKNCYRVWVSEIMLQQTQVATVIAYYEKFMQKFPTLESLAKAHQDEVLALWSGLGYYSRARNLHQCALQLVNDFNGIWPESLNQLQQLAGIGRSTAGAILSLAKNLPTAILDGNVKRVLCRFYAVDGWPGKTKVQQQLWVLAEQLTPKQHTANYNQAMMDMGATVCTRRNPGCIECPIKDGCQAHRNNNQHDYPHAKPKTVKPVRSSVFVIAKCQRGVLLEKRPQTGIWGGLWSLPQIENIDTALDLWSSQYLGQVTDSPANLAEFRHTFSHFHLDITPILIELAKPPTRVMDSESYRWQDLRHLDQLGLPRPVYKLLSSL